MRAVKAKYAKGKVVLPSGLPKHLSCDVTVLFPTEDEPSKDTNSERFRRAAGVWSGMDAEDLKARTYQARKVSRRRTPTL